MSPTLTPQARVRSGASWHPVAKLGSYADKRYGRFQIDRGRVARWKRTLAEHQNGEAVVDVDHQADKGLTKAAGWVRDLRVDDDGQVLGLIAWTDFGRRAVKAGEYRYVSPCFTASYRDEQGNEVGDALLGVSLTNRPFLRSLPALALSLPTPEIDPGAGTLDDYANAEKPVDQSRLELARRYEALSATHGPEAAIDILAADESNAAADDAGDEPRGLMEGTQSDFPLLAPSEQEIKMARQDFGESIDEDRLALALAVEGAQRRGLTLDQAIDEATWRRPLDDLTDLVDPHELERARRAFASDDPITAYESED